MKFIRRERADATSGKPPRVTKRTTPPIDLFDTKLPEYPSVTVNTKVKQVNGRLGKIGMATTAAAPRKAPGLQRAPTHAQLRRLESLSGREVANMVAEMAQKPG